MRLEPYSNLSDYPSATPYKSVGGFELCCVSGVAYGTPSELEGFPKTSTLVSCSISLYPATSAGERVFLQSDQQKHWQSHPVQEVVRRDTGEEVNQSDIIKGYQVEKNVYVTVEDEELEALQVDSRHTIEIDKFVPLTDIDERYFDAPYYIVPNDEVGQDLSPLSATR